MARKAVQPPKNRAWTLAWTRKCQYLVPLSLPTPPFFSYAQVKACRKTQSPDARDSP